MVSSIPIKGKGKSMFSNFLGDEQLCSINGSSYVWPEVLDENVAFRSSFFYLFRMFGVNQVFFIIYHVALYVNTKLVVLCLQKRDQGECRLAC